MLTKADVPPPLARAVDALRDRLASSRKGASVPLSPTELIPLCNAVLVQCSYTVFDPLRDTVLAVRRLIGRSGISCTSSELRKAEDAFFTICAQLRR